tara:strand:+ start:1823 stop:2728 length:906 start_codon:yes stop_codon:yes gene_type:complete
MRNQILFGDCKETLLQFDEKARMCVTSPPYYGLRDYGGEDKQIGLEETPEEYIDNLVGVFSTVRDCLTDDGTLWLNIGDSYAGSGKGPSKSLNQEHHHLEHKHSKIVPQGMKPKDLIGIPWMLAFALRADGWYLRQDIIWHKPNPMPESVKDRCTKAHEYIFLLSKNKKYYYNHEAIKEEGVSKFRSKERNNGESTVDTKKRGSDTSCGAVDGKRNKRSVWTVTPKSYKGAHFAVYPPELIEPCILAGSEEGDIVLDPFMGSGTTAMVAKTHGRDYIGCELHEEYEDLILERLKGVQQQLL